MSRTRRLSVLTVTAAAVALLVPTGARATHCASNLIVFSRIGVRAPDPVGLRGNPTADSSAIGCTVLTDVDGDGHEEDTNYVYPGSNMVKIRFTQDLGAGATLVAHLSGLGLDQDVTLVRTELATPGSFTMDGPWVDIDPSATGEIVATVTFEDLTTDTTTYRTVL